MLTPGTTMLLPVVVDDYDPIDGKAKVHVAAAPHDRGWVPAATLIHPDADRDMVMRLWRCDLCTRALWTRTTAGGLSHPDGWDVAQVGDARQVVCPHCAGTQRGYWGDHTSIGASR